MSNVITFEDVVVEREGTRALDGVSVGIAVHGITAIAGPSGAGKSTLLRLCNRLDVPTSGRVLFCGTDMATLDPRRLRRQVGMVFQRPTPFPGTVEENLRVASPNATSDEMTRALAAAGLTGPWLERDAKALSGGEAQRVCLARTLVTEPEVLLLDEPTSALDAEATHLIEEAVRGLAADGLTVLWVTHDPQQLKRVADHVVRLRDGRLDEERR